MVIEILLLLLFGGVLAAVHFARKRWITGLRAEPWIVFAAAGTLLVMAWTWGGPETRGASIVLTGGALLAMVRAAQLWRQTQKSRPIEPDAT